MTEKFLLHAVTTVVLPLVQTVGDSAMGFCDSEFCWITNQEQAFHSVTTCFTQGPTLPWQAQGNFG